MNIDKIWIKVQMSVVLPELEKAKTNRIEAEQRYETIKGELKNAKEHEDILRRIMMRLEDLYDYLEKQGD